VSATLLLLMNRNRGCNAGGGDPRDLLIALPIAVVLTGAIIGCVLWYQSYNELISSEQIQVQIVAVDPPKYASVNFKDLKTEEVYKSVRLGKRFSNWREKLVVGRVITVTRQTWKRGDQTWYTFPDAREVLEQ
jgi:hypothetical protein